MTRVDPPAVVNIADLRRVAKKRLPRVVFDYIDGVRTPSGRCARTRACSTT